MSLYNYFIKENVIGYKLNEFLGIKIELTPKEYYYMSQTAFLTFGYINTTDDVSYEEGTNNLINNKENIKINDYINEIENNLFGYKFLGVKILSLPDENKAGYFIDINNNNQKIKINDIIDIYSELKFIKNEKPILCLLFG